MEYEVVILELDDGTEAEFAILESFEAAGKNYVLLGLIKDEAVSDDEDDMLFMRDETDDTCTEDEIILTMIDTDEEYEQVVDEYLKAVEE